MITDLLLTDDLDLRIEGGDLVLGESTEQHLRLLLESDKGDWRATPYVGVGIRTLLLEDASPLAIQQEIQDQVTTDGARVRDLAITAAGQLQLQASYE